MANVQYSTTRSQGENCGALYECWKLFWNNRDLHYLMHRSEREKENQDSFQEKLLNIQRDQETVAQTKGIEHKSVF